MFKLKAQSLTDLADYRDWNHIGTWEAGGLEYIVRFDCDEGGVKGLVLETVSGDEVLESESVPLTSEEAESWVLEKTGAKFYNLFTGKYNFKSRIKLYTPHDLLERVQRGYMGCDRELMICFNGEKNTIEIYSMQFTRGFFHNNITLLRADIVKNGEDDSQGMEVM